MNWSHPAYANRHIFARNDEEILCASLEKNYSAVETKNSVCLAFTRPMLHLPISRNPLQPAGCYGDKPTERVLPNA